MLALVLVLLLGLSVGGPIADAGTRKGRRVLTGRLRKLPKHLGIGLAAHPDESGIYGWMPESGIPFNYAYQYLAGGVNTGDGWQTWNASAMFPKLYAQGARGRGYIPVFPYYMLLQSTGACDGCEEAQQDLAHLNDPAVMRDYFTDFATLMQRLGPGTHQGVQGFGKVAIVHVEPDLSGYAHQAVLDPSRCFGFCTGQGNDPSLLRAAVSSSGHADVAGYADTYRGFSLALAHLRDLYAPNVIMAYHVSGWSALHDIGSSRDPGVDPRALGRKVAEFANRSGVRAPPPGTSRYDLVFNDVADRDAGYYEHVYGRDVWWDRRNRTLPNFHRWEAYIQAIRRGTRRPVMIWQIPLGNQWFRTMNNTDGHYQDNRAEYFFSHLRELRRAGIIGLLFGRGNAGSTTNEDERGDGVTNPPAFCTSDGTSEGTVCNDHQSVWPDDDGGFLRMASKRYYRHPLPVERRRRKGRGSPG